MHTGTGTRELEDLYSLIIIGFAVKFAVSGVTSSRQEDAADRALETSLVPRVVHDAHDVAIRDSLTTADTNLDAADLAIDLAHHDRSVGQLACGTAR